MESLLERSNATPDFKNAVAAFLSGESTDRLRVESYVPAVKIRRLLTQLLDTEPTLEIERIAIKGSAGCSDFVGSIDVHTRVGIGPEIIDFVWDCRWRAISEGFVDYFGFPDQVRAAQEFDWRCFQRWERRAVA